MTAPTVSVVTPTFRRPQMVARAVRSALRQTLADHEVIVVVDGRDDATVSALDAVDDARLRLLVPDRHLGNADARNCGVRAARGRWIAFLDDDDEWLPEKLERQVRAADGALPAHPIVTCRMLARSEDGEFLWPRRPPRPDEPLSEYFFCRRSPFTGEGMVINSAVLTTRELAMRVPFRSGLERHVDPDWLLRAGREPDAALLLIEDEEPLLIWNIERGRDRITTRRDWRYSLRWASENRDLFTRRSYAAFVLHVVGASAAADRDRRAFASLLAEAVRNGRPAPVDLLSHCGNFLLPTGAQRRLAAAYAGLRG